MREEQRVQKYEQDPYKLRKHLADPTVCPDLAAHRDDILKLVRNVTVADPNLARAIGDAIHEAHRGTIDYQYLDEESRVRVTWERA